MVQFTMAEYQSLEQKIDNLEKLFNERFDANDKQHREIIEHQKETNGKVKHNTDWRNQNQEFIEKLKQEREDQRKLFLNTVLQILATIIGTGLLVLLGMKVL